MHIRVCAWRAGYTLGFMPLSSIFHVLQYFFACNVISIIADPTFDLLPPVKDCQPPAFRSSVSEPAVCQNSGQRRLLYNVDISCQQTSSKNWDADVSRLMSSDQWLEIYGLKAAKLDMNSLLRQIGFRHSDGKHSCSLDYLVLAEISVQNAEYRMLLPNGCL